MSLELWIAFKEPGVFWFNMATIAFGEAVVLFALGMPFYYMVCKNDHMCEILEIDNSKLKKKEVSSNE